MISGHRLQEGQGSPRAGVMVAARPSPFKIERRGHTARHGQTIAQILADLVGEGSIGPEVFEFGVVTIGGHEIPRDVWHRVRPRPGRYMVEVALRPRGGGARGGGGKNIFGTIAAIALLVAATAISGGLLGPGGALSISSTLFAAGSTSAALAAAGVSIVGALALNALAPTAAAETAAEDEGTAAALGSADFSGNEVGQFEPIPFVIGRHRVAPPHLVPPWTESVNDDQYINAIVGLNGAHDWEDIRVNGAPIDSIPGIEYETRNVIDDDSDLTVITSQVFETQINAELVGHKVKDSDTDELQDGATPSNSYPQWVSGRAKNSPDQIWLSFFWTGLINQDGGGTTPAGMPVRLRIRRVGDTAWINLPEFHAQRERFEPFRGVIKLIFEARPSSLVRPDQNLTRPPWKAVLYLVNADNDENYIVDSYFTATTSKYANNVGTEDGNAVVYLDPTIFPKGTYDVEVMRGYGYKSSDFVATTYRISSNVPYFFTHTAGSSPASIRKEQSKVASKVNFASISSVWDDYPLGEKGMALIAVRAKNVSISSLTAIASGYANVWNGADWAGYRTTRNPAAWWRTLALGGQSVRSPLVEGQLDDEQLGDWFDFCGDEVPALTIDNDRHTTTLLHFDGADASTTITDSALSPKTFTAAGNAQIDTTRFKFGRSSLLLDGSGDWVTTPDSADFEFGSGDFTVEAWFNTTESAGTSRAIIGKATDGFASGWLIRLQSGVLAVYLRDSATAGSPRLLGTTQLTGLVNTGWHHVALVRNGSSWYLFLDGAIEATATDSFTIADTAAVLGIGTWGTTGGSDAWIGWIDEVRISKGIARYAAAFDVQTEAFAAPALSYARRVGGLTGATDSKLFTFSCWFYIDKDLVPAVKSGSGPRIFTASDSLAGGDNQQVIFLQNDRINFVFMNASSTNILACTSSAGISALHSGWHHVMASFDMANTVNRHLYVDGVSDLAVVTTYTNDTIDFTEADWAIGAVPSGDLRYSGSLAELYFAPGVYIDLSVEDNRRKFLSEYGRPAHLGEAGERPSGTIPLVYFRGDSITANRGTGGNFTLTGSATFDEVVESGLAIREANAYISGRNSLSEILQIVAACGRAASRLSDKVGVIVERDRSDESPIALFSQRNTKGLTIRRAFPRLPDGLRVTFNDEDNDFQPAEVFVYRRGLGEATEIESVKYVGITDRDAAISRAYLDMRQMLLRPALYTFDTDIENLYCTKGSLVALAHDTLRRHYDGARVNVAALSGGNLTSLTLDSALRFDLSGDAQAVILPNDPDDAMVSLLLHFEGDDEATTITDSSFSPKTFTAVGNAQLDTAQSKFGASSGLFDGNGDYFQTPDSADFHFGSGDFTVDGWFRCAGANGSSGNICGQSDGSSTPSLMSFYIGRNANNQLQALVSNGSANTTLTGITSFSAEANTGFHHFALVRDGNTLRLFVDGVQEASAAFSGSVQASAVPFCVGSRGNAGGTIWNGWIDELRVTLGDALWTAAFDPPTKAARDPKPATYLRRSATSKLLLHFDGADASTTFTDSSPTPKTFTANGNAQIDTAQSKFGGASGLFDGTGDYISTPHSVDFNLSDKDFTIDGWFRVNAAGGTFLGLAGKMDSAAGANGGRSWSISRNSGNFMYCTVYIDGAELGINATTQFTNAVNTGWHHVAMVRTGDVLKLFIDGVQEGGDLPLSGAINNSASILTVGGLSDALFAPVWNGWLDEFRIEIGTARWTSNFTPPAAAFTDVGGMIGATDSKLFTISCWLKKPEEQAANQILSGVTTVAGGTRRVEVTWFEDKFVMNMRNAAGTTILNLHSEVVEADGQWHHFLASIDLADTAKRHVYIDDIAAIGSVVTYTNDTIDFTVADWAIGATPSGGNRLDGSIAELWFAPGVYLDLSVEANRREFLSPNGRPVNLGATGNGPTGSAPLIYLTANDGDFDLNQGTGGGFGVIGAVEADSLFYTDGGFPAGVVIQLKDGSTLTAEVDEETESATATFATPQPLPDYLTDEGAWSGSSVAYQADDVVSNDGAAWECIADHTSGVATEPGTGADWADYWSPLLADCLVAAGPFSSVEKRMLVLGIKPSNDMTASITLVDEAPPIRIVHNGEAFTVPDGGDLLAPL